MLISEVRWFVANYLLLNLVGFAFGLAAGIVLIFSSADGTIPGYAGSTAEQVFWFGVGAVFFGPLLFGVPVLAACLLTWRLLIRVLHRPRLTAFLVAAVVVVLVAALVPRTSLPVILFFVAAPAFAYAAIARQPRPVLGEG